MGERLGHGNRVAAGSQTATEVGRDLVVNLDDLGPGETLVAVITKETGTYFRATFISDGKRPVRIGTSSSKIVVTRQG